MTVRSLLKALDTIVDKVEFYHGDYILDYSTDTYHAEQIAGKVRRFRVYETEETTILMVVM